jgi:hypothetical protein
MTQITLKQSIFFALEMRSKFLDNVEPEDREAGVGQRYARHLLDSIIECAEEKLEFDQVQRDLGYAAAIIVERNSAKKSEIDALLQAALEFDMVVTGSVTNHRLSAEAKTSE